MNDVKALQSKDWVSHARSHAVAWGLPGLLVIAGSLLYPSMKAAIWVGALVWMGVACLANAARCRRTHCYFTGPYFLALAVVAALHGFKIIRLGTSGWLWLGLMIVAGGGILWFLTERVWGKFLKVSKACPETPMVERCGD